MHIIESPPAFEAAAKEAGKEPPMLPQAGWRVYLEFVALSVASPEGRHFRGEGRP